jgi:methionyl-tRNA formyltransferase
MRIAILCNDRLALPALDFILSSGMAVAVGMASRESETHSLVKTKCAHAHIPFDEFRKKNFKEELTAWLDRYAPDVVIVKTFPYLIPVEALMYPKYGFINFHYAPLPAWRGSNPLFWMIRKGATTGGVTVHQMNETYDAGPILLQQSIPISTDINFGIFYTQLAFLGLKLTMELVQQLQNGSLQKKEQDHSKAEWYTHPSPSDLFINWNTMTATEISALVKACNPWNKGAATRWKGWTFGITYASVTEEAVANGEAPGSILSIDTQHGFTIACSDGRALLAEVVYCEEGFYPGYCLSAFGLQAHDRLS